MIHAVFSSTPYSAVQTALYLHTCTANLHEGISDDAKTGESVLLQVDLQSFQLQDQRLPVRLREREREAFE